MVKNLTAYSTGHSVEHSAETLVLGSVASTSFQTVVLTDSSVPAGWPSPAQDYTDRDIDLTEHLIAHPTSTFIVRVAGDSMVDAGIWDGDELIVDRALTPKEGDIVVAAVDGDFTVKTLSIRDKALRPANIFFDPIDISHRDVVVWGVVTSSIHHFQ